MIKVVSLRRLAMGLWVVLFPLLVVMLFWPINSLCSRLGILIAFGGILFGAVLLVWRYRNLRIAVLGICCAIFAFLLLPGRPESARIAPAYVGALSAYEGDPYVWGGETRFGIDCSGLVRKGRQNALLREGLLTLNPSLVRAALDLWWNDTTAKEIGKGYDGRTGHVVDAISINELDLASIRPGDLAVAASGIHVMAYLGDDRWIGADPGEGKVTVFTVPERKNGWFSTPVRIMRWTGGRG